MLPHAHLVHAIGMPQGMEWLIVLVIALLLFGSKLPAMMRGMGGSIKEFKKGMEEGTDDKKTGGTDAKRPGANIPDGAVSRDDSKPSDNK